jgi:(2S)-methylsuccinyl-CoA dehydrogenase
MSARSEPTSLHDAAALTLTAVQSVVDAMASALKGRCVANGKFSSTALDEHQLIAFELAHSAAGVAAAHHAQKHAQLVGQARPTTDKRPSIEESLANIFLAEAVADLRRRVADREEEFGLGPRLLSSTINQAEVRAFCATWLSASSLSATGARIRDMGGTTGARMLEEDHELMRTTFRDFALHSVEPYAEEIHRKDTLIPDEILTPLVEMGCFGLSIPERFGGMQPDDHDDNLGMITVTEELSRGSLIVGSLITRPEIVSRALLKGGTVEQQERWLPRIAAGELLCSVAITEPDYGSDVAGLRLNARPCSGGWVFNGAKTWCTFGGKADLMLVIARTNTQRELGHKGLSMFLVEKPRYEGHEFELEQSAGGKLTGRAISTIGYRGMHSFDLFFDDFFVPAENLVGLDDGLGKGFYYTMAGLAGGRIQTAARALGVMQAAFDRTVTYGSERKVFGKSLDQYQLTLAKFARMASYIAVCRQFTYGVGRLMDDGGGSFEAALVKLFTCRVAEWVTREATQIHGGMGYAEETAVSRNFLDARVLGIFEGAEETLALKVVARGLVTS